MTQKQPKATRPESLILPPRQLRAALRKSADRAQGNWGQMKITRRTSDSSNHFCGCVRGPRCKTTLPKVTASRAA